MNYEQFIYAMLECIKEKLPGTDIAEVQKVQKNNGVKPVGLVIRKSESGIAPVIYLEKFYEYYQEGWGIEELSLMLLERSRNIPKMPKWNYEEFKDFRKIQDKIVYKIINAKANEELLKEVPHLPILDFAIVFSMILQVSEQEMGSILIKNSHLDLWKCPISILYDQAKRNTPKLCPPLFCPLTDILEVFEEENDSSIEVHVLTNRSGINGAATLLYPCIPQMIFEQLGNKYYLLPSSIHEFLIIPENQGMLPESLRKIVREVNETQLDREEFLSDEVYYFNGEIITKM